MKPLKCLYCKKEDKEDTVDPSLVDHKPNKDYDVYYCGCLGWGN